MEWPRRKESWDAGRHKPADTFAVGDADGVTDSGPSKAIAREAEAVPLRSWRFPSGEDGLPRRRLRDSSAMPDLPAPALPVRRAGWPEGHVERHAGPRNRCPQVAGHGSRGDRGHLRCVSPDRVPGAYGEVQRGALCVTARG